MRLSLLVVACLFAVGCQKHAMTGPTYFIGLECNATATLVGCDTSSPPHCKQALIKYDKHCEKLVAK